MMVAVLDQTCFNSMAGWAFYLMILIPHSRTTGDSSYLRTGWSNLILRHGFE